LYFPIIRAVEEEEEGTVEVINLDGMKRE